MFASQAELDLDYYVNKQIVTAAARVLSFFGITEKDLLKFVKKDAKQKEEKSLEEYLSAK